jgi:glycosyltransferase involved in cell wall biosynthesis
VVAIRNTDLSIFYKYFPHIRPFGMHILENARAIVLISPSWKQKLKDAVPADKWAGIEAKCTVIPNPVDDFWQENKYKRQRKLPNDEVKLVYAGRFMKKKGLHFLIRALDILNQERKKYYLNLIGGGGKYEPEIRRMVAERDTVQMVEQMPKEQLMQEYRKADIFAMPSHTETFGLVYIEAISQGLPILYSRGEGIDSLFEDGQVGYAAQHDSPEDIAAKIKKIEQKYSELSAEAVQASADFTRSRIAGKYKKLYLAIINPQDNA